jgi:hypothetical protein
VVALHIEACTIDAADPEALATFWCEALGWATRTDCEGDVWVEPPDVGAEGPAPTPLLFLAVPEPKLMKNRLHLDLRPDDQAAEVERLVSLGARRAEVGQTGAEDWVVLADPEGNEFCVLPSKGTGEPSGAVSG